MQSQKPVVETVNSALHYAASGVVRLTSSTWDIVLQNGKPMNAHATLDATWLSVRTHLKRAGSITPWRLLCLNSALPPSARFAFDRGRAPVLLVDTLLAPDCATDASVMRACSTIVEAMSVLVNNGGNTPPPESESSSRSEFVVEEEVLQQSSWTHTRLDDGAVRFDFDARGERYHALLEVDSQGLSCRVENVVRKELTGRAREAIGVALLSAANRIRLTRATAATDGTFDCIAFEVRLPQSAPNIDLALGALVSTCEHVGREVQALTDDVLASTYLEAVLPHSTPFQRG